MSFTEKYFLIYWTVISILIIVEILTFFILSKGIRKDKDILGMNLFHLVSCIFISIGFQRVFLIPFHFILGTYLEFPEVLIYAFKPYLIFFMIFGITLYIISYAHLIKTRLVTKSDNSKNK